MASRYYPRERQPLPPADEDFLDHPSPRYRNAAEQPRTVYEPALSLPHHNGEGAFASHGYPSPTTESSRYSLPSSLVNSLAAQSSGSDGHVLVSQTHTPTDSNSSWQDFGTLSLAPSRPSRASNGREPTPEIWQWSINSRSRVGDESDWVSPSFPSSLSLLSQSQPETLEMSIDSDEWKRVRARSRAISSSTLSRSEAEAFLVRRRQRDGADPSQETLWEALLRRLLMLDGATLKMLKGEEGGSLFFEGQEAPLLVDTPLEEPVRQPQEHALTTFLSHVASSLSPSAAIKRGLSVLPLPSNSVPVSVASPKAAPEEIKGGKALMAAAAGSVAWYVLSALPLLISLEAGGRVWRVWKMVQKKEA